ncbi:hypothetical protein ABFG93_05885 [Pseudalkalibacillus hwajinpoensis]|uniref:hypothetical protein n=1 Tax=Guptibacillus hwajinpoensis TaxID=208199 RepID=UPI00325BB92C
MLHRPDVKPPYILIGYYFCGINVRLFASTYPEDVAGVILLESCHEDHNQVMAPLFTDDVREDYYRGFKEEGSHEEFEESLEQVRVAEFQNDLPLLVFLTGGTQPHHTIESMKAWILC